MGPWLLAVARGGLYGLYRAFGCTSLGGFAREPLGMSACVVNALHRKATTSSPEGAPARIGWGHCSRTQFCAERVQSRAERRSHDAARARPFRRGRRTD